MIQLQHPAARSGFKLRHFIFICVMVGNYCLSLQYPSLFTVDGEWVSITQTIKVKHFYRLVLNNNKKNCHGISLKSWILTMVLSQKKPKNEFNFIEKAKKESKYVCLIENLFFQFFNPHSLIELCNATLVFQFA